MINITMEDSRVIRSYPGGATIDSTNSIEANLLFLILQKLEEMRCCIIDVENAVLPTE
jgi:hypothetical protein